VEWATARNTLSVEMGRLMRNVLAKTDFIVKSGRVVDGSRCCNCVRRRCFAEHVADLTPAAPPSSCTPMASTTHAEPSVIVIFGASGDLTSRKLIPALYELFHAKALPKGTCVVGVSRTDMSDDAWRTKLQSWVKEHAKGFDDKTWREFVQRIFYFAGDATELDTYPSLIQRLESLSHQFNVPCNVLFYLSVAPALYEPIIECIGGSGIVTEGKRWCALPGAAGMPWQRIIVEKPFGVDAATAASLNRALGRAFEEDAIYRIDHYLAKELVQGLLVFRFANTIFEPLWNHRYIDHVQITAAETVGVGKRAEFYDQAGAIRDMIQSHLLQVLALVAMEPPTSITSRNIRNEKVKVIEAIKAPPVDRLAEFGALGQYDGDAAEPAYHANSGVKKGTTIETFAALKFHFDNWRWAGTPFYLRTGKRLAAKRTEIVVQFKQPPADLFSNLNGGNNSHSTLRTANQIVIEIAPRESVSLRFEGKVPGPGMKIDSVMMDFDFAKRFKAEPMEAYGPLLLDAMRGDQTLYKHGLEVENAWDAVMPFIDAKTSAPLRKSIRSNYKSGSWGPASADELMSRSGRAWHNAT
jgi:glucose-6-phosphate 1-dehydrogenase